MALDAQLFANLVSAYGAEAKVSLSGPGDPEAQLTTPVANFISAFGDAAGLEVSTHGEVRELEGAVRPDLGVLVNKILTGHIELKAPGTSLDPATYAKSSHNFTQWQRLKELPNILTTNGTEWRLWRYGEQVDQPVHVHTSDLTKTRGRLTSPAVFELILSAFINWEPVPIVSVSKLVDTLAPLARLLREEVKEALRLERKAKKAGAPDHELPFLGLAKDWRRLLFPLARDDEFGDGFSQTVVFALLLAVSDDIDLGENTLYEVAKKLEGHHTLMGMALKLLTEHIGQTGVGMAVDMVVRVLRAADWEAISNTDGRDDVYLHLYEHFLSAYDPEKRRQTGSYYTPIEVVDAMVRLTDDVLKKQFHRSEGLRDPHVTVADSSMGTGTFPLSVLRHVGDAAANQFGPGARPEAVTNMAARLYGIELQSGPFSVAELRLSEAMKDAGASLPEAGLNMYVADTLEDPAAGGEGQFSYSERLIGRQRQLANKMKRELNLQVSIGNPPYREKSQGLGGWIESGIDTRTGKPPLDAFRAAQTANHSQHLLNLYAYFWRWSTWKVFESTDDKDEADGANGLICYITSSGYLVSPGFKGMREYLRRTCSHGWVIDISPEGKQPPAKNAVFNIETPVAIALFARVEGTTADQPADIKFIEINGTRDEKFDALDALSLDDENWQTVRTDWQAPFTPAASETWDAYPACAEVFAWSAPGIKPNRTWVYGPTREVLEERLREVINEDDPLVKAELFKNSYYATLDKTKDPLEGMDTEQGTRKRFRDELILENPKIVRVGYRSFDRQYIVADSRLIHSPSSLWPGRIPGQIFAYELHSHVIKSGPAVTFSALIPDTVFYKGSDGGHALPMLHPDGSFNLAPGLLEAINDQLGGDIGGEEVTYYLAGVLAHPGFVRKFSEELLTPGVRVPMTTDRASWDAAVQLGANVVWLHTYGERGAHPQGYLSVLDVPLSSGKIQYEKPVGSDMPSGISYDEASKTLRVGAGTWSGVSPEARAYVVGGNNVIDSWTGYRLAKPKGRRTSPLDDVNVTSWPAEWSQELSELLSVLSQLVDLQNAQEELLDRIVGGPTLARAELERRGVRWPVGASGRGARSAKLPAISEREARHVLEGTVPEAIDTRKYFGEPHPEGWVFASRVPGQPSERWIVNGFRNFAAISGSQSVDEGFSHL